MTDYQRPELTEQETAVLMSAVVKILFSQRKAQIKIISHLLIENALLTQEVNNHRAALGYDPLPTYSPNFR